MPQAQTIEKMSEAQIAHKSMELRKQGKVDEARALLKTIPVWPGVAWAIKRREGIAGLQDLRDQGYDLTEVEAKFGREWLAH
jgi:hypothetical protein